MAGTRLTDRFRRFRGLEGRDKRMFLHATLWLGVARLMLFFLPFRKLATILSGKHGALKGDPEPELLQRIGSSVRAAAGSVPWRSDCFPQSIAAHMLLRHHGYKSTIHLGVERVGDDELSGHAWLTCGGAVVTGGEDLDRYVETLRIDG